MPRATVVLLFFFSLSIGAEEWTRFRGPNGSGISKDAGFPAEIGRDKNVVWRTPVRAGKSSPVLTNRHVFLTGFEDGKLYTQCFDRATGKLVWERAVERVHQENVNPLNHPAAITSVTDGENVYVFFKDFGLVSYDGAGAERWRVPLGPFTSSMGLGASPILAGGSVVVVADQLDHSFIAAFDGRNGEMRWKIARDEMEGWGTPLFWRPDGGTAQIVTASRGFLGGHSVADGKRAFTEHNIPTTIVGSPVLAGDTVFVFGYGSEEATPFSQMLDRYDKNHDGVLTEDEYRSNALIVSIGRYVGNGDRIVTKEKWDLRQRDVIGPNRLMALRLERDGKAGSLRARELWRYDKSFTGVIPTALVYADSLYVVRNGGVLTSFDPKTGEVVKAARVTGAIGGYSSSPVAAEGRIYLASEDGKLAVIRAGRDWEVMNVGDLGEGCYATPALSEGRIYLRSSEALYCFGSK